MITIIPAQEILKAVVDDNISSSSANLRRTAFDMATELMSLGNVDVLIEGILYKRIEEKLNDEHKIIFNSLYRIDNSAMNVTDYNIHKALKWVAKSESNSRKVILISDDISTFAEVCNNDIKCFTSSIFIDLVNKAQRLSDSKMFSTLDDALIALAFMN